MAKCTDKEFLEKELNMGISLDNPSFMDLARNTVAQLNGYGSKILDYGCGVGAYSKAAIEHGFEVYAFEKFKAHKDYLKVHLPELKVVNKLPKTDILMFIETAEHMTDDEIKGIFQHINPIWILFSSTSEKTANDEMWGHINVKDQKDWDEFFLQLGYRVHKQVSLPTEWSKIYQLM
jgi:2-polyprenyl-3-methyl-5-hydroxy-6-metoxy-1,4-benzoquinol methylase